MLLVLAKEGLPPSVMNHLQNEGLRVVVSTSPLEASGLLVKQPPDAFYVSLSGLEAQGAEIVALARQHVSHCLVVAGLRPDQRAQVTRVLEAGADGWLLEPVVAEELLALLRRNWAREDLAERDARRSVGRQAVTQLARAVAHQVNNPLGTLSGWLQMLRSGPVNQASVRRAAESAEVELKRLAGVVETLLILSEQMSPRRKVADLTEVVRRALAGRAGEPLALTLTPGLPPVSADEELLEGALRELLDGEALTSARPLAVATAANGRMVEVDVLLAGEGLKEQGLEELLDPLRLFDEQGGEKALAFARAVGVIRVHGGEVSAQRELDGTPHLSVKLPVALA
jgi:two-component system sensor histidine kinase HydH